MIAGIPFEFILFAATLLGVALFHHYTLPVALAGLCAIVAYKLAFTGFASGPGVGGLLVHLGHEWGVLAHLFGLDRTLPVVFMGGAAAPGEPDIETGPANQPPRSNPR